MGLLDGKKGQGGFGGIQSGTRSMAGRSIKSGITRKTGTMSRVGSRVGSRKSHVDDEIEEMEVEQIDIIIEEKEREMREQEKLKMKIQKNKSMSQGAKDTKMKPHFDRIEELKN